MTFSATLCSSVNERIDSHKVDSNKNELPEYSQYELLGQQQFFKRQRKNTNSSNSTNRSSRHGAWISGSATNEYTDTSRESSSSSILAKGQWRPLPEPANPIIMPQPRQNHAMTTPPPLPDALPNSPPDPRTMTTPTSTTPATTITTATPTYPRTRQENTPSKLKEPFVFSGKTYPRLHQRHSQLPSTDMTFTLLLHSLSLLHQLLVHLLRPVSSHMPHILSFFHLLLVHFRCPFPRPITSSPLKLAVRVPSPLLFIVIALACSFPSPSSAFNVDSR